MPFGLPFLPAKYDIRTCRMPGPIKRVLLGDAWNRDKAILHLPQFVDSDARNKRIAFGKVLRGFKTLRLDDVVTSDGFHVPW